MPPTRAGSRLVALAAAAWLILAGLEFMPGEPATARDDLAGNSTGVWVGYLCLLVGIGLFVPRVQHHAKTAGLLVAAGFLVYGAVGPGWSLPHSCGCLGGRLSELPSVRLAIAAALTGIMVGASFWREEPGPMHRPPGVAMRNRRTSLLLLVLLALVAAGLRFLWDEYLGASLPPHDGARFTSLRVPRSSPEAPAEPPSVPPASGVEPAMDVTGVCVTSSGQPIAGVRVVAVSGEEPHVDWRRTVLDRRGCATSDEGGFRLAWPNIKSPVLVVARHPAYRTAVLEHSERPTGPIRLTMNSGASLSGRVVTRAGLPIEGARIVARGRNADGECLLPTAFPGPKVDLQESLTDAEGRFELGGLLEQEYIIDLHARGLRRVSPGAWFSAHVARPGQDIQLVVDPVAIVRARVIDDLSGRAVRDAAMSVATPGGGIQFVPNAFPSPEPGAPVWTFLLGPPGTELCMFGVPGPDLPRRDNGMLAVVGICSDWPVPEGLSVAAEVVAPGYEAVTASLPLVPLDISRMPAPAIVRLRPLGGLPLGRLRVQLKSPEGRVLQPRVIELNLAVQAGPAPPPAAKDDPRFPRVRPGRAEIPLGDTVPTELSIKLASIESEIKTWMGAAGRTYVIRRSEVEPDGIADCGEVPVGFYEWIPHRGVEGASFTVEPGSLTSVSATLSEDPGPWNHAETRMGLVRLSFRDGDGRPVGGFGFSLRGASGAPPLNDRGLPIAGYGEEFLAPGSSLGAEAIELTLPRGEWILSASRPGVASVDHPFTVRGGGAIDTVVVAIK